MTSILVGLVLILSIVFVTNFYNQTNSTLTGRVVQGQECSIPEQDKCEGQNTFICINGEWQNAGYISGKCDDTEIPDEDCIDDDDCFDDEICQNRSCVTGSRDSSTIWIIIIILIILILGVIGFIIYMIIKKDNKKRNKSPGKMFKRKPHSSTRRPLIKQSSIKPMKKPALKPLAKSPLKPMKKPALKPITKPSNVRPLNAPKPPAKKPGVQRYNPPKR